MPEHAPDEEPPEDAPEEEPDEQLDDQQPSPEEIGVPEDEVVFETVEAPAAEAGGVDAALQARIAELEDELAERTDQLARAQADYQNYRKRMQRQEAEARTEAKVELLRILVEAIDDLERARSAADPEDKVAQGVTMVTKRLDKQLADHGVEAIAPEAGDPLAPEHHEALMSEPSEEVAEGRVLEALQTGYVLDGRLVRPALVKVSDGPASEGPTGDEEEAGGEDQDH